MRKIICYIGIVVALLLTIQCDAQTNTRTRQIRFATGVQYATDTTANAANAGRVWYDFTKNRFRVNENGTNKFLVSTGGGAYTGANGLTLSGTSFKLGGTLSDASTDIAGNNKVLRLGYAGASSILAEFDVAATTSLIANVDGVEISTANAFSYLTMGTRQYATGTSLEVFTSSINVDTGNDTFVGLLNYYDNTSFGAYDYTLNSWLSYFRVTNQGWIYAVGLPTANPCASRGSGAVWSDAGTLKVCP
jgi:hypothetical protein